MISFILLLLIVAKGLNAYFIVSIHIQIKMDIYRPR